MSSVSGVVVPGDGDDHGLVAGAGCEVGDGDTGLITGHGGHIVVI